MNAYDKFIQATSPSRCIRSRSSIGFGPAKRRALIYELLSRERFHNIGIQVTDELKKNLQTPKKGLAIPIPWYVHIEAYEAGQDPEQCKRDVLFQSFHEMMLFQYSDDALLCDYLHTIDIPTNKRVNKGILLWYCLELIPNFMHVIHHFYAENTIEESRKQFLKEVDDVIANKGGSNEFYSILLVYKQTFHTLVKIILTNTDIHDIVDTHLDRSISDTQSINLILNNDKLRNNNLTSRIRYITTKINLEKTGILTNTFNNVIVEHEILKEYIKKYLQFIGLISKQ